MKICLISDTHGQEPKLPEGDILIHAGDLSMTGSVYEINTALEWLNKQSFEYVVIIAGNHDYAFESAYKKYNEIKFGRVIYLEDTLVSINNITIYGSPYQPWYGGWAFNKQRGKEIKQYWDMIPNNLDILVTHGPPYNILDENYRINGPIKHVGCEELLLAVERTKPKIHCFGHIHGAYGYKRYNDTQFYNASIVNDAYKLTNKPWEIEL